MKNFYCVRVGLRTVAGLDDLVTSRVDSGPRSGRDAWAGYWIDEEIPDWPPERLGREAPLARSLQIITPHASRPLRESMTLAATR